MSESESLVERVATAIFRQGFWDCTDAELAQDEVWETVWPGKRAFYLSCARAAIQAMREPTPEMVRAAPSRYMTVPRFPGSVQMMTVEKGLGPGPVDTFRAMIDAALA